MWADTHEGGGGGVVSPPVLSRSALARPTAFTSSLSARNELSNRQPSHPRSIGTHQVVPSACSTMRANAQATTSKKSNMQVIEASQLSSVVSKDLLQKCSAWVQMPQLLSLHFYISSAAQGHSLTLSSWRFSKFIFLPLGTLDSDCQTSARGVTSFWKC